MSLDLTEEPIRYLGSFDWEKYEFMTLREAYHNVVNPVCINPRDGTATEFAFLSSLVGIKDES